MCHLNNFSKLLWKFFCFITILLSILLQPLNGSSQVSSSSFQVKGKILDSSGAAVSGATISEKGTKSATSSNDDGSFSLLLSKPKAVLNVSYVGYENKQVNVNGRQYVEINLQSTASELGQVVVVGYGTQRKGEVTSAITSLKPEDFNKGNMSDPIGLLQGKVAALI